MTSQDLTPFMVDRAFSHLLTKEHWDLQIEMCSGLQKLLSSYVSYDFMKICGFTKNNQLTH